MAHSGKNILALSGGVGGAKLALGLADIVAEKHLHIMVNTGDDFVHLGLHISPDIDTLLYTLSGRNNQTLGWGLEGETWNAMAALERLGGDTWFRLGDSDIATHLWRTQALLAGSSLLQVTFELSQRMNIGCAVYPMSNEPVRTTVLCDEGPLPFQHYFVRRRCEPVVSGFQFEGIQKAQPVAEMALLLQSGDLAAVLLCPSNPFVSIDPMLQIPGQWQAIKANGAPVIAVSPIVAGTAIKGPAAKMMRELNVPVTALGVAQHYAERYPGLLDILVIDQSDAKLAPAIRATGVEVDVSSTIMRSREDKQALARRTLQLAGV